MTPLPNKRDIVQPILDIIESGWIIVKPSPLNPDDIERECIFQHPQSHREVKIGLESSLFLDDGQRDELIRLVRRAISQS